MASNESLLLILLVIFSLFAHLGFSDLQGRLTQVGAVAAAEASPTQCIQKLIPCQKYLNKNPNYPPSICCLPLQDMIANETQCLCKFFNDLNLLKSLNVVQDDILKLLKACGANADTSKCRKLASAPSSAVADAIASSNGTANTPKSDNTKSSTTKFTSNGIILGFATLFITLVLFT